MGSVLSPQDLKKLSNDQLRELVLELQSNSKEHQNDEIDEDELSSQKRHVNEAGYASITRDDTGRSSVAKAKERAWDSHFFNPSSALHQGVRSKSPPKSKHPFQRRLSAEFQARTEMLMDFSKEL